MDIPVSAYVQNGLSANFDALTGKGGNTWRDTSGTYSFTLTGTSWTDDSLSFSANTATVGGSATAWANMPNAQSSGLFPPAVRLTIEVVARFSSATASQIFFSCDQGQSLAAWNNNGVYKLIAGSLTGKGEAYYFAFPNTNATITAFYTGESADSIHIDGVLATFDQKQFYGVTATAGCYLGRRGAGNCFNGEICAVRVYDHELTAAEIAFNAALDRVRYEGADPAAIAWPDGYRWNSQAEQLECRVQLAVNNVNRGSVSATVDGVAQSGNEFWAPVGSAVVVTPAPAQGYRFKKWTSGIGSFTVDSPFGVSAFFTLDGEGRVVAVDSLERENNIATAANLVFGGTDDETICTLYVAYGEGAGNAANTNGWTHAERIGVVYPDELERTVPMPAGWGTQYFAARFFLVRGMEDVAITDYSLGDALHVYDGLNNAGIGVYDANSTIWKDLVTANPADFTITANGTWTANGLKCNGVSAKADVGCTTYLTIEAVYDDATATKFLFNGGSLRRILVTAASRVEFGGENVNGFKDRFYSPSSNVQVAGVISANGYTAYTNAAVTTSASTDTWGSRGSKMSIGNGYDKAVSDQYSYKGTVMAIRLYSTALDEAILKKHAIYDRFRYFGEDPTTNQGAFESVSDLVSESSSSISVIAAPEAFGVVSPDYGLVRDCVVGQSYTFTSPAETVAIGEAGNARARCIGWKLYRSSDSALLGANDGSNTNTCTFTFTESAMVEWQWQREFYVSAAIDEGSSLDFTDGWYVEGTVITLGATCPDGDGVKTWAGAPEGAVRNGYRELVFTVGGPIEIDASVTLETQIDQQTIFLAKDGDDGNDGLTPAYPKATFAAALEAATDDDAMIVVADGVYTNTASIVLSGNRKIRSVNGPEKTTIYTASAITVVDMSNDAPGAEFRGFTLASNGGTYNNKKAFQPVKGTIADCVVTNFHSSINVLGGTGGTAHYTNVTMIACANNARYGIFEGSANFIGCRFLKNRGANNDYGCVLFFNGAGTARNCLIAENTNTLMCSAVRLTNGARLENCTIVSNQVTASSAYGAVRITGTTSSIKNCLIKDNFNMFGESNYTLDAGAAVSATYTGSSPAFSGTGNVLVSSVNWGEGFSVPYGPTVDAGMNDDWMTGSTDLAGNPRINNEIVDMGCFEAGESEFTCWIDADPGLSVLMPSPVTVSAGVAGASGSVEYGWKIGGAAYAGESVNFDDLAPGEYEVGLFVTNGVKTAEASATLKIISHELHVATDSTPAIPYDSAANAFHSVKAAMDYSEGRPGAVIKVHPGEYDLAAKFSPAAGMSIVSTDGAEKTRFNVIGGITAFGCENTDVLVKGLTFASTGTYTQGLYPFAASKGTVADCVFENFNTSGDAIKVEGSALITNCVFRGIKVHNNMSAMLLDGPAQLVGCKFLACSGDHDRLGQTIQANGSPTLRNCLIANCTNTQAAVVTFPGGTLDNCSFVDNVATGVANSQNPGVIHLSGGTYRNTVIFGNTVHGVVSNATVSGSAKFKYCCADTLLSGEGNIAPADAKLRHSGPKVGMPFGGSPVINAGTNLTWMTESSVDIAGQRRIRPKGKVDIGCYEYGVYGTTLLLK